MKQENIELSYLSSLHFFYHQRLENEQRRLRNDEQLPEIPSIIKKSEMPDQLSTLLMSNHIGHVTEQISAVVSDNLCRSFFVSQ